MWRVLQTPPALLIVHSFMVDIHVRSPFDSVVYGSGLGFPPSADVVNLIIFHLI